MIALIGSVLAASLLGSPHCAGMCGGFVCFVAGQDGARRFRVQAAYHAGRLATYVLLGTLAGALGAGLERWGSARGVSHLAALVAGLAMILWGSAELARALGIAIPSTGLASSTHRQIAAVMRWVRNQPPALRALVIGLSTTLLPCGWLYAFVATAAGTGSAWGGAATMAAFWAGTVPILAGLGAAARGAFGPLRRRLPVLSAVLLIAIGLLTVAGKFRVGAIGPEAASAGAEGRAHECP